jgi:hypothetical protein
LGAKALRLLDVIGPLGVVVDRVDREPDDLDAALVELRLDFRHIAELGGANGREILRMGEQDRPGVSDPIVEVDFAFRGLGFEIRGDIADVQRHDNPPSA